jgi:hypothetical protein
MQRVTLKPTTKRLKQVIQEHGAIWLVLEERPTACFDNELGLFIEAERGTHQRWVRPSDVERMQFTLQPIDDASPSYGDVWSETGAR